MRLSLCATALVAGLTAPLEAQSLLYRAPNMGGTWVPDAAVVQFNFLHRFYVTPPPSRSVINYPSFTLAAGFGHGVTLGSRFATKSLVGIGAAAQTSNETELFARWRAFGAEGARGFTVAVTPAYNFLAKSLDGELALDWTRGFLTLQAAGRGISRKLGTAGQQQLALAGAVVARLTQYVAVGVDVGSFVAPARERAAWSAGLDLLIPGSPHTFSLQASNATSTTIQGASIGYAPVGSNRILYGFEFTIPLHLKRFSPWFKRAPKAVAFGTPTSGPVAAEIRMAAFKFQSDSVVIAAGQTVRWANDDPVEHTITFDGDEPGSPPIPHNGTFSHRFDKPGTYTYHCTPHPYMKGVVVVR